MENLNIVLIMSLLENLEKKVNDVDKRLKDIEDRFKLKSEWSDTIVSDYDIMKGYQY